MSFQLWNVVETPGTLIGWGGGIHYCLTQKISQTLREKTQSLLGNARSRVPVGKHAPRVGSAVEKAIQPKRKGMFISAQPISPRASENKSHPPCSGGLAKVKTKELCRVTKNL